jgi:hypothetical protein
MEVQNNFIFNFAVSKSDGGLKRLFEFCKWFDENGGASFIIHPDCIFLKEKFKKNKYFVVFQSRMERIFNDCAYLSNIKKKISNPDLYYSYGIPIYHPFGKVNWFHLSNVLPISNDTSGLGLSFFDRFARLKVLDWKIKKNLNNADIVSAESENSLRLINNHKIKESFLSINGSDDEIKFLENNYRIKKEEIAVVVGTQRYKRVSDAYLIFQDLRNQYKDLKLVIIGNIKNLSRNIIDDENIILTGALKHTEVIEVLKKAKFYISTTRIENSFNNASEGIFLADESYISDIASHRELLQDEIHDYVSFDSLNQKLLKIKKNDIKGKNLILWSEVIDKIINKVKDKI